MQEKNKKIKIKEFCLIEIEKLLIAGTIVLALYKIWISFTSVSLKTKFFWMTRGEFLDKRVFVPGMAKAFDW